jgi:hypothetical protein
LRRRAGQHRAHDESQCRSVLHVLPPCARAGFF